MFHTLDNLSNTATKMKIQQQLTMISHIIYPILPFRVPEIPSQSQLTSKSTECCYKLVAYLTYQYNATYQQLTLKIWYIVTHCQLFLQSTGHCYKLVSYLGEYRALLHIGILPQRYKTLLCIGSFNCRVEEIPSHWQLTLFSTGYRYKLVSYLTDTRHCYILVAYLVKYRISLQVGILPHRYKTLLYIGSLNCRVQDIATHWQLTL